MLILAALLLGLVVFTALTVVVFLVGLRAARGSRSARWALVGVVLLCAVFVQTLLQPALILLVSAAAGFVTGQARRRDPSGTAGEVEPNGRPPWAPAEPVAPPPTTGEPTGRAAPEPMPWSDPDDLRHG